MAKRSPEPEEKRTQAEHIASIIREFSVGATHKYHRGQVEHGGRLWRKAVYELMEGEVLDFVIYYFTAREQMREARAILRQGMTHQCPHCTTAFNIIETGNPQGIAETDK